MASKIAKFFVAGFAYMWFISISMLVLSSAGATTLLAIKIQHSSDFVLGTGFIACLLCFYTMPWFMVGGAYLFGPFIAAFFSLMFDSVWLVMAVPPLTSMLALAVLKEMIRKSETKAAPEKKNSAA